MEEMGETHMLLMQPLVDMVLVGVLVHRQFDLRRLRPMLVETASLTGAIIFIVGCATAMAWGLTDTPDTAALVIISGATMPWPGGLGPFYAVTGSRIGAATVIPAITAFAAPSQAEGVIDGIFAPNPTPEGYADYVGAPLTMRRASLHTGAGTSTAGLGGRVAAIVRTHAAWQRGSASKA